MWLLAMVLHGNVCVRNSIRWISILSLVEDSQGVGLSLYRTPVLSLRGVMVGGPVSLEIGQWRIRITSKNVTT